MQDEQEHTETLDDLRLWFIAQVRHKLDDEEEDILNKTVDEEQERQMLDDLAEKRNTWLGDLDDARKLFAVYHKVTAGRDEIARNQTEIARLQKASEEREKVNARHLRAAKTLRKRSLFFSGGDSGSIEGLSSADEGLSSAGERSVGGNQSNEGRRTTKLSLPFGLCGGTPSTLGSANGANALSNHQGHQAATTPPAFDFGDANNKSATSNSQGHRAATKPPAFGFGDKNSANASRNGRRQQASKTPSLGAKSTSSGQDKQQSKAPPQVCAPGTGNIGGFRSMSSSSRSRRQSAKIDKGRQLFQAPDSRPVGIENSGNVSKNPSLRSLAKKSLRPQPIDTSNPLTDPRHHPASTTRASRSKTHHLPARTGRRLPASTTSARSMPSSSALTNFRRTSNKNDDDSARESFSDEDDEEIFSNKGDNPSDIEELDSDHDSKDEDSNRDHSQCDDSDRDHSQCDDSDRDHSQCDDSDSDPLYFHTTTKHIETSIETLRIEMMVHNKAFMKNMQREQCKQILRRAKKGEFHLHTFHKDEKLPPNLNHGPRSIAQGNKKQRLRAIQERVWFAFHREALY